MTVDGPAAQAVADVVRREWPRVVATLVGITGDLGLAEDAAQDAALEALKAWRDEIPRKPAAWILTVARRRAIDRIRREVTGRHKTELLGRLEAWNQAPVADPADEITGLESNLRDDQLRLIFGCCHPALSVEAQTALTLRSVGGLTTTEISHAFLVPEPTMAQRLVRAKRKIGAAAIPFTMPSDSELLDRLAVVHHVVYLIFNEGYAASTGDSFLRVDLCAEAIRLGTLLVDLVPDDAESLGLLALMLATDARSASRVDSGGVPVLLEEQDRSGWDSAMIETAHELLDRALRLDSSGPLQIQAAIALLHDDAPNPAATDWRQIELLYRTLCHMQPTPVVRLNHAVAVAMAHSPAEGLALLDKPELSTQLDGYRYFHAARAELLVRLDRSDDARSAYARALELTDSGPEAALLERKRSAVGPTSPNR